ncbi:MAG: thioesterase family protein, partial [Acidimicrobiales bacterium]
HGGPVAALVARAVEQCQADPAMQVARLTVELLRPVPVTALSVASAVVRPGRKVQVIDVRVTAGDTELAWGRAVRIRAHEHDAPAAQGLADVSRIGPGPADRDGAPPGPHDGHRSPPMVSGYRGFHNAGAELRFVRGEFDQRGPATVWVRLAVPVVPGEEPTPTQRAAAAADFGNGVSSVLDFENYVFINPDLTLYLDRPPEGEWICLDASTLLGTAGVGLAQSGLWDIRGPVGRSLQSLVVEHRT